MTSEQAYFFTVALINLVLAFSGTRIKDPEGKQRSILFFILAFAANFLSWFIYVFDIGVTLKIISVLLSSVFIWGMVVFSYKRCECSLPVAFISAIFLINCVALSYFTYAEQLYNALHVSALFVPLAFCMMGYLFLKIKQHRNPSDIILAYACFFMAVIVASRSLLLKLSPELFSATVISSQIIWPAFSVISGVFALLSYTEEVQFKLQQESNTDQLTGLANRRSMDRTLNKEWARADRHQRPLALMMLDVDFFKNYNDQYGHQAGDDCLKAVAQCLLSSCQRAGELAVRYGGEEFLLILPETDITAAKALSKKICASIAELEIPHHSSPQGVITLSSGIAVVSDHNYQNIDELLRAADSALYQAKQNGRNQTQIAQKITFNKPILF
ncbi:diguanylate cyclase [Amphritea pacifica]|uniref:diguanylate cyclase n=1 Tax=Amphritea pacifica TaxID=2811233 RepID=A0ABS2WB72_9GAMM|nr:diguanylate cyclase [Amphritea pacifica]MBN0988964.1 GGDEF domain-containing protein [Amphritea pacifica]MBN1005044.1 GGDEF domain-containing protein [Amphritea pacifica]